MVARWALPGEVQGHSSWALLPEVPVALRLLRVHLSGAIPCLTLCLLKLMGILRVSQTLGCTTRSSLEVLILVLILRVSHKPR